jgi:hypothetical protein
MEHNNRCAEWTAQAERDEHIRFYAEAWDISIEDAAQRLFGGES